MPKITVTAVQAAPMLFDRDETVDRFAHWLKAAKDAGSALVVFPEAFLGGYPKGVDFGARVGSRNPEGRELFRQYYNSSFDPSGDAFTTIRRLVSDAGVHVVTGLIEPVGDTLHCASAIIGPDGDVLGWHRKLMPTAMERLIWGMGDGATDRVIDTPLGRVSMSICWENYMPLHRAHLYQQGSQLYCVPTVDDRTVWLPSMQMIALEGRCFVISACQYMTRSDVAAGEAYDARQGNDPDSLLIAGGSCIISPAGDVVAEPLRGTSGVVHADIDTDDIARGKFDLDVAGHYARPDVFSLSVNETPHLPAPRLTGLD